MHERNLWIAGVGLLLTTLAGPAQAQGDADRLLREMRAAYGRLQSLTADLTLTRRHGGETIRLQGTVKLRKPNLARVELSGPFSRTIVSDGKTRWTWFSEVNRYRKEAIHPRRASDIQVLWARPVSLFFDPERLSFNFQARVRPRLLGTRTLDGTAYRVIEIASDELCKETVRYFIGPDRLVHRMEAELKAEGQQVQVAARLSNLHLNPPLGDPEFAYAPPAGASEYREAEMARSGSQAPSFTLPGTAGSPVALAEALRDHRAVLLNFWFLR
jgi:outer membrane lipoprotein-sorting protein